MSDQRSEREAQRLPRHLCDYCRKQVDPWGVKVTYADRWYHLRCWDAVVKEAAKSDPV